MVKEVVVNSRGENWFVGNLNPEIEIRITPYGWKDEEPEENGLPDYSIRVYRKLFAGD